MLRSLCDDRAKNPRGVGPWSTASGRQSRRQLGRLRRYRLANRRSGRRPGPEVTLRARPSGWEKKEAWYMTEASTGGNDAGNDAATEAVGTAGAAAATGGAAVAPVGAAAAAGGVATVGAAASAGNARPLSRPKPSSSTPIGERPTTCRWARSTCSTTHCCASRSSPTDVKPRLLGHWGTTPGLNFIYAHMNRVIRNWDLDAIYVIGPGHGGPAAVANAYLEGTYSEVYPHITRDEDGLAQVVPPVQLPWRHPVSRRPRDAGLHPRRRGAWLRALPRVRRRLRQPGPARLLHSRRRGGRDRAACDGLAFEQVPGPGRQMALSCPSCT